MKKFISVILTLTLIFTSLASYFTVSAKKASVEKLRLVVPDNWEMSIGDSRSVDYVFSASVTNRVLSWSATPENVATVDKWGRVTAKQAGKATVTAKTSDGLTDSVTLSVVETPTMKSDISVSKKDYEGTAAKENDVLQKVVTRYERTSTDVPEEIRNTVDFSGRQSCTTKDKATWTITSYGVLRKDKNAANERDSEMRFMGDRYFYEEDTGTGRVLGIFDDGENGIWTVMNSGITHISMENISGEEKASQMSETTQEYVARRGMVSESYYDSTNDIWDSVESDNDGLWTSMYGAGEIMRYSVLKNDPNASKEEIEKAKKTAYQSAEAVLLLTYISMRDGTTQSLVKAQRNGSVAHLDQGKWYSSDALLTGGDYSQNVPEGSPYQEFQKMQKQYMLLGKRTYIMSEDNLSLFNPVSFAEATSENKDQFETRTRLLTGFWARTYSLPDENHAIDGYIHWDINDDNTATGVSTKKETDNGYLLNGENMRGVKIDASKSIPQRLWDDLIGSGYDVSDIVYKGDTSSDEIIGHLFIYKLAYDVLGSEDEEMAYLIKTTMNNLCQHLVDNGYALCDGTGQPTTWGKFSRTYFHNGQVLGGAPLQSSVCLCIFKLASYITGYQKWEDEYKMCALDPDYEYAKLVTQEWERYQMCILEYINDISKVLGFLLRPIVNTKLFVVIYRLVLNYSDEEMGMLAYYLLFQLETDETLLSYYREGISDWWKSIGYSENPLWYYIYQLAFPSTQQQDFYGNSLIETASWSLSRHPIDTRKYLATNENRDDIGMIDLTSVGLDVETLSYDLTKKTPYFANSDKTVWKVLGIVLTASRLTWKVAAPDERALHKYNGSSYYLGRSSEANCMEGSTTYTLPYWLGRYHGMLK